MSEADFDETQEVGLRVSIEALTAQIADLGTAVVALETNEDGLVGREDVDRLVTSAVELGALTTRVEVVAEAVVEDYQWWKMTADPATITAIAPVFARNGFQTLRAFYTILQGKGVLPEGMSSGDLNAWFDAVQEPIEQHIAATSGRRVLWLREGRKLTLSYIQEWDTHELAEPEEAPVSPPAQPARPVPVPAPAPSSPAPVVAPKARPEPSPAPKSERVREDPSLTAGELEIAEKVIAVLSSLGAAEFIQRPALLHQLRHVLEVSRSRAEAFDGPAKVLMDRLARRGLLEKAKVAGGGFKFKLAGDLRGTWRKNSRQVLDALGLPYVIPGNTVEG